MEKNEYLKLTERLLLDEWNENSETIGREVEKAKTQLAEKANDIYDLQSLKMDKNSIDISVSQINKNRGKIEQTYLTDTLLEQMVETTPLLSEFPNRSITTSKVNENSVTGEIISDEIIKNVKSVNLLDDTKFQMGGIYNYQTGLWSDDANAKSSPPISVKPNVTYTKKSEGTHVTFWDGNLNFVTGIGIPTMIATFTVPNEQEIAFVRYSLLQNENNVMFVEGSVYPSAFIEYYNFDNLNQKILPQLNFVESKEVDSSLDYTRMNGYYNYGVFTENSDNYATTLIPVHVQDIIQFGNEGYVGFYNKDYVFLKDKLITANYTAAIKDENVKYIAFHWLKSRSDNVVIKIKSDNSFKKIKASALMLNDVKLLKQKKLGEEIYSVNSINEGSYYNNNTLTYDESLSSLGFIPIEQGNVYELENATVRFYDKNKQYIRILASGDYIKKTFTITSPNEKYMHISFETSLKNKISLVQISGKSLVYETDKDFFHVNKNDPELLRIRKKISEDISKLPSHVNGKEFLRIPTPYDDGTSWDGRTNQSTHPSCVYFPNGWNGYKLWLAFTPYAYNQVRQENPCIAVSNDGIKWETPSGLTNPLVSEPTDPTGYNSDTHLFFNATTSKLELWYREVTVSETIETLYRIESSDGLTWSMPQITVQVTGNTLQLISPSVLFEGGKYKLWIMRDWYVYLLESMDGVTWSNTGRVKSNGRDIHSWHPNIQKIDGLYHMVNCDKQEPTGFGGIIKHSTSHDGVNWTEEKQILTYTGKSWDPDGYGVYRSSIIKKDNLFFMYYGMYSHDNKWTIGLTVGNSIDTLIGIDEKALKYYGVI